jgi:organic radical activating enzyme
VNEAFRSIAIQLTEHCNLQCPYCFAGTNDSAKNKRSISPEDEKRFLSFCRDGDIRYVKITGGEPFLYERIYDFLDQLGNCAEMLIFSNLTVPKCIENLPNAFKIVLLVNVNDPYSYSAWQSKSFRDNIETAAAKKVPIILGKTFYERPFDINYLVSLSREYGIKKIRVSQSSPSATANNKWLLPSEIRDLYRFIHEQQVRLKSEGIMFQFDCPVAPCIVEPEDYRYFVERNQIASHCKAQLYLSFDMKVGHCYATSEVVGGKSLKDFSSYRAAYQYIEAELKRYKNTYRSSPGKDCTQCSFDQIAPCGCYGFLQSPDHPKIAG